MKNGEYESKYQKQVIKELRRMNALLLDHTDHIISIRAALEVILVYLPACASEDGKALKESVMRLGKAFSEVDKRIRRSSRKFLRSNRE